MVYWKSNNYKNEPGEKYVLMRDYKYLVGKYETYEEADRVAKDMPEDSFCYLHIVSETHWNMLNHM